MEIKVIDQHDGRPVQEVTLVSSTGVKVTIMSYGAIVRSWQVPVAGDLRHVALGFSTFAPYLRDTEHLGAIVGRVANRIGGAQFRIGEKTYTVPNNVGRDHLHGGPRGLGRRNWNMSIEDDSSVKLTYHSPRGEMGYPGDVDFTVVYRLSGNTLRTEMSAVVSELTPVNMVQHQYFNLAGYGNVLDHQFQIEGDAFTPLTDSLLPTGEVVSVDGTDFDLRQSRSLRKADGTPRPYDVNFSLSTKDRERDAVATVVSPQGDLTLRLWSDQPGLQFYTSEHLKSQSTGHTGKAYAPFDGFCLEDQMFPDALNHPQFPSILVSSDKTYSHWCEIEIK